MNSIAYSFGLISIEETDNLPIVRVEYEGDLWWRAPLYPTDFQARRAAAGGHALQLLLPGGAIGLNPRLTSCQAVGGQLAATLADPRWPGLEIRLALRLSEEGVFSQEAVIANGLQGQVTLLRADSLAFSLPCHTPCRITTFRGCWAGENQLQEQPLLPGNTLVAESAGGLQNALDGTPGFVISPNGPAQEESGHCILGALCWSGCYSISFSRTVNNSLFARLGHHFAAAPYSLAPGQSISLPQALVALSDNGKGDASRRLHRYLRRHVIPRGQETRSSLLNSWEGVHFDVREPVLQRMMRQAAELGIELFVLDDGWFGERADDTSSLGDWRPNAAKLPGGLAGLSEYAARQGIGFGLWVEPEMVCPDSDLYRARPDWAIRLPGLPPHERRHQLVLNLARPEVEQFVLATVSGLLKEAPGISYVKWDCNRPITDAPAPNLYFDHIAAYYRIMRTLRQKFPHVVFQCCSAGGGRLDLGAARYHEEFWLSDNTDPFDRLKMQWSASHFFPANAIGAHVTASPNLYTRRKTSLKFRFDVALGGRLGFELDPGSLSPDEAQELRDRLALAQELRPLVQLGDLYRLVSPFDGPDAALLYAADGSALLLAYTTERRFTDQGVRIPLRGLDAATTYRIEELMPNSEGLHCRQNGSALPGRQLMRDGLFLLWNAPMQSALIRLAPSSGR